MSDNDGKNMISKAILLTIRGIEGSVLFATEPVCSKPLFDFFIGLEDELTGWLKEQVIPSEEPGDTCSTHPSFDKDAFLTDWKMQRDDLIPLVNGLEKDFIDYTNAFDSGGFDSLQECLTYLSNLETEGNILYKRLSDFLRNHNITIPSQPQEAQGIPEFSDNVYNIKKDNDINATVTHCDKGDGAKVKHRLGIYCNEQEDKAVCAVYPWIGERKADHDKKWIAALVGAVVDKYPKIKSLILVCHDKDFDQYDGWDTIISDDYNQSISDKFKNKVDEIIKIPFAVFQHATASDIPNALKENVTKAYDIIEQYVSGHAKLKKADSENKNAIAHFNKYPKSEE